MVKNQLVLFLDVLGTKNQINSMVPLDSSTFVNPIIFAAESYPSIHFAVFSDCVIISCSLEEQKCCVSVLGFLYNIWIGDGMLVRGGLSFGEIRWINDHSVDKIAKKLNNISFSRVYGKALVNAHNIEGKSGPGAMCFIDRYGSNVLDKIYVLEGPTDCLICAEESGVKGTIDICRYYLKEPDIGEDEYKHWKATLNYFIKIEEKEKWLPDGFIMKRS